MDRTSTESFLEKSITIPTEIISDIRFPLRKEDMQSRLYFDSLIKVMYKHLVQVQRKGGRY